MKEVFLATAFAHVVDRESGEVVPAFREKIERLLKALREEGGAKVYCEMEHEGWKLTHAHAPEIGVQKGLKRLDKAEVLVALMHEQPSVGMEFELGYAVAKGKIVLFALEAGGELSGFNQGLVSAGLATLITYDDAAALAKQLIIAINAPAQEPATP